MIELSESLSAYVRRELKIDDDRRQFTESELASVSYISMSRDDMPYIPYFRNLSVLSLEHYPSLSGSDLEYIGKTIPSIISLKIKEQNGIYKLDLSPFKNLVELAVIHNDNLIEIKGLKKVKRFTFYDNKEYKDIKQIVDFIKKCPDCMLNLDFLYYIDLKRNNIAEDVFNKISWIESLGLRNYYVHEYSQMEINFVMDFIERIVSKYTFVDDTPFEKFAILYVWMIQNVKFINEDDKENVNSVDYNNTYKVLNSRKAGRISFAKTFQMLLEYAGFQSYIVYSYGALDSIGFYEGKKIFSLLGSSDYTLLRLNVDGNSYYSDIAWDSMIDSYKYADALRLFLVSKDELAKRHKIVGEGNVLNSHAYGGDDSADLILFAKDRIAEVDESFGEIEKVDSLIFSLDVEIAVVENILASREMNNSFKYDGEKEGLTLTIQASKNKKNELLEIKKNLIKNYSNELIRNYIGKDKTKDNYKEALEDLKNNYLISNSLYNILSKI